MQLASYMCHLIQYTTTCDGITLKILKSTVTVTKHSLGSWLHDSQLQNAQMTLLQFIYINKLRSSSRRFQLAQMYLCMVWACMQLSCILTHFRLLQLSPTMCYVHVLCTYYYGRYLLRSIMSSVALHGEITEAFLSFILKTQPNIPGMVG